MRQITLFFYALVAILFISPLPAQIDTLGAPFSPKFLSTRADTCRAPRLSANVTINNEGYSKAYLEFDVVETGRKFTYQLMDGTSKGRLYSRGESLLIEDLLPGKLYEVLTQDNCGNEAIVAVISTFEQNTSVTGIYVSDRMYQALTTFQKQKVEIGLPEYLDELDGVSPYEKIAFIQQHYYNGNKLLTDEGVNLPAIPDLAEKLMLL